MSSHKKNNKPLPPPGIHTDYSIVHTIGLGGVIDEKMSSTVVKTIIDDNISKSNQTIQEGKKYYISSNPKKFDKSFVAFKEAIICYPITQENWHSGERIPFTHAEETSTMALTLAFQGHYKSAFQSLREIIELIILQLFFYKQTNKSIIGKWGRGEIRTPSLREMIKEIKKDELVIVADTKLGITNKILQNYDELGAYIHTRGISTTTMGLTGSNMICFSEEAFSRFLNLSTKVYLNCIVVISTFFPASIIAVKAFDKLGHFDPAWILRENAVKCVRGVLNRTELDVLEKIAVKNNWFQNLIIKVNSLKSLSKVEIDETYDHFIRLSNNMIEYINHIKKINKQFE